MWCVCLLFPVGFSSVVVSAAWDGWSQRAADRAATTSDAHPTFSDVFGSPANGYATNNMHRKYKSVFILAILYSFERSIDSHRTLFYDTQYNIHRSRRDAYCIYILYNTTTICGGRLYIIRNTYNIICIWIIIIYDLKQ